MTRPNGIRAQHIKTKLENSIVLHFGRERHTINTNNLNWIDTESNHMNVVYLPSRGKGTTLSGLKFFESELGFFNLPKKVERCPCF